jgi:pimeloyl-ACP methyl ester carboxylesterase
VVGSRTAGSFRAIRPKVLINRIGFWYNLRSGKLNLWTEFKGLPTCGIRPVISVADVLERSMTIGGLEHGYLEAGSPGDDPIVLLHDGAFGSDALSCWGPVLGALSARHRVIAPDLTGYGRSPKLFHFDMNARTQRLHYVRLLLERLGVAPAAFVGASFGGSLVLQAALERWTSVTSVVSICGTGGLFMNATGFRTLGEYSPGDAVEPIVDLLMASPPGGEVLRRTRAAAEPAHWKALRAPSLAPPNAPAGPPPDRDERYRASLAGIAVPVLLVGGSEDELLATGWEQDLASLIPGARAQVIAGARHFPQIDQPERTAAAILDFVDG